MHFSLRDALFPTTQNQTQPDTAWPSLHYVIYRLFQIISLKQLNLIQLGHLCITSQYPLIDL